MSVAARDRLADAAGRSREVLRAGDRAGRAHDLEHLAGVKVLTCMGRSNVTLKRAGRAVEDQVVVAGAVGHREFVTWGPGTISGRRVLVERRA